MIPVCDVRHCLIWCSWFIIICFDYWFRGYQDHTVRTLHSKLTPIVKQSHAVILKKLLRFEVICYILQARLHRIMYYSLYFLCLLELIFVFEIKKWKYSDRLLSCGWLTKLSFQLKIRLVEAFIGTMIYFFVIGFILSVKCSWLLTSPF